MVTFEETLAAAPLNTIALAAAFIWLLLIVKLLIVVPEAAVLVVTDVIAVGASIAVAPPFPPA